ncbi:MAG: MBL fold metallo-hydrolase [Syntrophomonadaceae bacterium]|nr:MBL fold metallo-hydrolase [Syntrophomonadaceae bacterium]
MKGGEVLDVQISVVIENTAQFPGIIGEYGLGMLVKVDGKSILFDTGMAGGIVNNLKTMGIPGQSIELIAISHGHFDHAGGLTALLDDLGPRHVYLHPYAALPKYTKVGDGSVFIGMPRPEDLEQKGARLVFNEGPVTLVPGVILSGTIPRTNDFEDSGGNFMIEAEGCMAADTFADDQALYITHPEGLIVVGGCAHAGMINTLEYGRQLSGVKKIKAWIGGTHLMTAGEERMYKTIEYLKGYDIDIISVSHCTGFLAAAKLYGALGSRVSKGECGSSYTF